MIEITLAFGENKQGHAAHFCSGTGKSVIEAINAVRNDPIFQETVAQGSINKCQLSDLKLGGKSFADMTHRISEMRNKLWSVRGRNPKTMLELAAQVEEEMAASDLIRRADNVLEEYENWAIGLDALAIDLFLKGKGFDQVIVPTDEQVRSIYIELSSVHILAKYVDETYPDSAKSHEPNETSDALESEVFLVMTNRTDGSLPDPIKTVGKSICYSEEDAWKLLDNLGGPDGAYGVYRAALRVEQRLEPPASAPKL